jgi:hypothetical protein
MSAAFCFAARRDGIIFVIQEQPEGGYSAGARGHSIFTAADTLPELNEMVLGASIT